MAEVVETKVYTIELTRVELEALSILLNQQVEFANDPLSDLQDKILALL